MSDLTKFEPRVLSTASPDGPSLLAARLAVQRSTKLRDMFVYARTEKIPASELAEAIVPVLSEELDASMESLVQVARYLADEYEQIGDRVLIVSRTTGRAIAAVTDDDFWQPGTVPREDGTMARPTPRLKPEIEGFLVNWEFTEARDTRLLAKMFERGQGSGLVRDAADKRLLPITRMGRKQFIAELREALPTLLPDSTAGGAAQFLGAFVLRAPASTEGLCGGAATRFTASLRIPLQDPITTNLHHSRWRTTCVAIANQWVRTLARTATQLADHLPRTTCAAGDPLPNGFVWAADPDVSLAVHGVALPTDDLRGALGIRPAAGYLAIDPDAFEIDAREVHDRWEILAMLSATVWIDPSKVLLVDVPEITYTATLA